MSSVPKDAPLAVMVEQCSLALASTLRRAVQLPDAGDAASRDETRRALIELIEVLELSLKEATELHDTMTRSKS